MAFLIHREQSSEVHSKESAAWKLLGHLAAISDLLNQMGQLVQTGGGDSTGLRTPCACVNAARNTGHGPAMGRASTTVWINARALAKASGGGWWAYLISVFFLKLIPQFAAKGRMFRVSLFMWILHSTLLWRSVLWAVDGMSSKMS